MDFIWQRFELRQASVFIMGMSLFKPDKSVTHVKQ